MRIQKSESSSQKIPTKTFRDLIVWQKAKKAAVLTYEVTGKLPPEERFGLSQQMRRAAVSISSNIAEGYQRFHKREKQQFLAIAYGSAAELQSQLEVAEAIFNFQPTAELGSLVVEVQRMLNTMLSRHA